MEEIKSKILLPDDVEQSTDIMVSRGNNDSSLVEAFIERYKFKIGGTPTLLPKGYDFNETGYFYGKVDTLGRTIVPKSESLVEVDTKFTDGEIVYLNKDLYALYLDFYEKLKLDFALNKLDINIFTEVFTIARGSGFSGEVDQYYKVITSEIIKEMFIENVVNSDILVDNAENFPLYLENILKLFELKRFSKEVLYNEFLLSGFNDITNTGLSFEISTDTEYDDNIGKFENYYRFPIFGRIVAQMYIHGMRYDKNAPWRFVMDFNLKPTVQKIGGLSKQQYFEKNFDVAEGTLKEMEFLLDAIYLSYLSLLEESPLITKDEQVVTTCVSGLKKQERSNKSYSFYRKSFTRAEFDRFVNKNFNKLLIQYAISLNSVYGRRDNINNILLDIQNKIKKGLDKETVVRYTFNKMKYC